MAGSRNRNIDVSRGVFHQMFHSRSLQNERLRDKAIKIQMFLDRGIYEDLDREKFCPQCELYYENTLEYCPVCNKFEFDETDTVYEEEWDDDKEDFHGRLKDSFDPFDSLKEPEFDIKELLKNELHKFFKSEELDKEKARNLSSAIMKNLCKYSDHMIMLFDPSLVMELSKIKNSSEHISDSYEPRVLPFSGINTFPLAEKEILSSSLKGFSSSLPSFPSLSDVMSIRKALELDPFHHITGILTKFNNLLADFQAENSPSDTCFGGFLEKLKDKNIAHRITELPEKISSGFLKKSEVEDIKNFLDLLLEWYRSYKTALQHRKKEKTVSEDKSLSDFISNIAHDYNIEHFISDMRDGFICFDEPIEKVCHDISNIFLRIRQDSGKNPEEALSAALKNYYILCLSVSTECERKVVEKSLDFIKNLNMNKRKLRKYLSTDEEARAGIIIEQRGEEFFVNIPSSIPENIKIKDNITGKDREEAKVLLDGYMRKMETLRMTGEFLIKHIPSAFEAGHDIKKEIYKFIAGIYQGRKGTKGKKITVEQLLIEEKKIDKSEISRIFNSESLLFPSGDKIPLKNFLYTKKDILDEHFSEISSWIKSMPDRECADRVNEYFGFGEDFIASSDIKHLRERQQSPEYRKTRGRKIKK